MSAIVIPVDFNNCDVDGAVRLVTKGSVSFIEDNNFQLRVGETVLLSDGELLAEAELQYRDEVWVQSYGVGSRVPDFVSLGRSRLPAEALSGYKGQDGMVLEHQRVRSARRDSRARPRFPQAPHDHRERARQHECGALTDDHDHRGSGEAGVAVRQTSRTTT